MKIGIYGGSFNPVHNGHLGVARAAVRELKLDRLIVIPAAVNPFKAKGAEDSRAGGGVTDFPAFDRLLLVRAAFNGMAKVEVDDRELKRGGVSYAIDTVREIAAENPGAEIFFVVGEDSVARLSQWKDADELWKLCTPKSFPRTRESSTEIRARLVAGESVDDLVPAAVSLFIRHRVGYNEDAPMAGMILEGLKRKEGYCPCRLPKNPEFFCPCDEFKAQLADPDYHGLCHCRLYRKP